MFTRVSALTAQGRVATRQTRTLRPSVINQQKRLFSIHEYQGLALMRDHGLSVVKGAYASTPEEAAKIAEAYFDFFGSGIDLVVKAQVLAGGRGKGKFDNGFQGGVHVCLNTEEVRGVANKMLGHKLVTLQTGPAGKPVNKVLVCERKYLRRETYISIFMDRESGGPVIIGAAEGGVNIEVLAQTEPHKIIKEVIDPVIGLTKDQANSVATRLGFSDPKLQRQAAKQIELLYTLFWNNDCTLVEVNPFAETSEGEVVCMDSKINFDTNAIFRHPEFAVLRDTSQEDPRDVQAHEHDLNYIGLDGNIGCLVNGAGLAMATMDIISLHGGTPANFLDVGGGASEKQVMEAFRLLTSDPKVKSILVNIFGGIMRCDIIALGIVRAAQTLGLHVPVVIRLQGTNVDKAKEIISASGLRLIPSDDLDAAAESACKIAKIMEVAADANLKISFELPI